MTRAGFQPGGICPIEPHEQTEDGDHIRVTHYRASFCPLTNRGRSQHSGDKEEKYMKAENGVKFGGIFIFSASDGSVLHCLRVLTGEITCKDGVRLPN
ncbi:MAG: hypothetical protein JJ897_12925 [Marinibacterium sp.]|nr:hypothetical protein [Marinibacterium sp.]